MKGYTFKMSGLGAVVCFLMVLILLSPSASLEGTINGLMLCGNVIIPSLFPFCALAIFFFKSGIADFFARIFSPLSKKLFHLSGKQFCVFLMSFLAGYPVGMRLICELAESGEIDKEQAKRMGLYCVNAGPAFILVAVGEGMLADKFYGIILLISSFTATLILALITKSNHTPRTAVTDIKKAYISDAFVEGVAEASKSVFGICGWVILFSALLSTLSESFLPSYVTDLICSLSEVTTAAVYAKGNILKISATIGFGGLSVHCQIYSSGKSYAPKYTKFLLFRLIHAAISVGITYLLLKFYGKSVAVISSGTKIIRQNVSFTYASAAALMILCAFSVLSLSYSRGQSRLSIRELF